MIKYGMLVLLVSLAPNNYAQAKIEKQSALQWSEPELGRNCRTDVRYGAPPVMVSLSQSREVGITLAVTGEKLKTKTNLTLTLSTNKQLSVQATILDSKDLSILGNDVVVSMYVPPSFLDDFAKSTFLKISSGRKLIASVLLTEPERVVGKLKSCNEQRILQEIAQQKMRDDARRKLDDEMMKRPPNSPAVFKPQSVANSNDYPSRALQQQRQGVAIVALHVASDGTIARCAIHQSSGHADLDAASCSSYVDVRFWPALGANREPIESVVNKTIRWVIP